MSAGKQRHRSEPDTVFAPAAAGLRVRLSTGLVVAIFLALLVVGALVVPRDSGPGYLVAVLAPLGGLMIVAIVWFTARIRCYRLHDGELVVERVVQKRRIPLAGLLRVDFEPGAPTCALKILGNDGLGAMVGRFWNKRLGKFRAYLTNGDKAVVMRWPEQTLVISPERPQEFTANVRKRTGIVVRN